MTRRDLFRYSLASATIPCALVAMGSSTPREPALVQRVETLRQISALQLTPAQLRVTVQQLSNLDRAQRSFAVAQDRAAASIQPQLQRVQDALLAGKPPDPDDQTRIHAALAPVQPERDRVASQQIEVLKNVRGSLNRVQLDRVRQFVGISIGQPEYERLRRRYLRREPALPQGPYVPDGGHNVPAAPTIYFLRSLPLGQTTAPGRNPVRAARAASDVPSVPAGSVETPAMEYQHVRPLPAVESHPVAAGRLVQYQAAPAPQLTPRDDAPPASEIDQESSITALEDDIAVRLFFLQPGMLEILKGRAARG